MPKKQKEESTAIEAVAVNTAVANVDQALLDQMKAMSGEANGGGGVFIPILSINNKEQYKDVEINGVMTNVKLDPEKVFIINDVNPNSTSDDDKFISQPFIDSFEGTILKVRYKITKKWKENDPQPYFSSDEFDNFKDDVIIYANKEEIYGGTYAGFKEKFAEQYVLWIILYVVIGGQMYRMKLKGQSRSTVWDYMKAVKANGGSITTTRTMFSLVTNTEKAIHYNVLVLETIEGQPDIQKNFVMLRDLCVYLEQKKKKDYEVLPEDEITVDGPVFD